MLDGLHGGFERHHGFEPQLLGEFAVAVQQQPWAHHVEVRLGVSSRGARVGAVAQPELLAPLLLDGGDDLVEQFELVARVGERVLALFVGHREVGENALGIDARHLAVLDDALDAAVEEIAFAQVAQTRHARVDLDVHLERLAEPRGLARVVDGLGLAGDRLGDVVVDELFDLVGGGVAQDQDGHGDAVGAQLHGLVDAAHGQVIRARFLQAAADLHRSVPVGVGFDDAHELHVVTDVRLELSVVAGQRVEVDFSPGPFQCRCHVCKPPKMIHYLRGTVSFWCSLTHMISLLE